ncbi:hypothetical protein AB4589_15100 [Vibrio sp. 10N.222.49.A3]|uniref:hypothetical protein n=1 Tax=Vibrio sp. 10N.222.49.A3 TaxID=3229611 RepID=UPI0035500B17
MKTSTRRKMYSRQIIENHHQELEYVFEELSYEVSYILAGAIVVAEDEYNFHVDNSMVPDVVSDAVKHLINQGHYSPICHQMPLVLRAIRIYRKNTVPELRGYQTLCTGSDSQTPPTQTNRGGISKIWPLAALLAKLNRSRLQRLSLLPLAMLAVIGGVLWLS